MKKAVCIVLSLAMALGMAACGNANSGSVSESPASSEAPSVFSASEASASSINSSQEERAPESSEEGSSASEQEASSAASTTEPASQPQSTPEPATSSQPEASQPEVSTAASAAPAADESPNVLIAYFSFPETDGVDAVAGASRVIVNGNMLGNTQYVAQVIQQTAGGDLFRIEAAGDHYPGLHEPLVDQAATEQDTNARPALASQVSNLEDYDVVFLGFPNWWGDLPMPLYTFLETHDLSGKTVIPFSTHGGSGFSGTIRTISSLQPNATVITEGYTVSRNNVANTASDITSWVDGLNL